jgi:hypothetical protein
LNLRSGVRIWRRLVLLLILLLHVGRRRRSLLLTHSGLIGLRRRRLLVLRLLLCWRSGRIRLLPGENASATAKQHGAASSNGRSALRARQNSLAELHLETSFRSFDESYLPGVRTGGRCFSLDQVYPAPV